MDEHTMSEKLFLDLWQEYDCPNEIHDKIRINDFLSDIVKRSKGNVILDHYSHINFDRIEKIEVKDKYTLIHWFDNNAWRQKMLEGILEDFDLLSWWAFGYATYEYYLLDIAKIRFARKNNHLYILPMSNLIQKRGIGKTILLGNTEIETEIFTSELYTQYAFWEGNPEDKIKHFCLVGNLPYYTCVIHPKENCSTTAFSKRVISGETVNEAKDRILRIQNKLALINDTETDDLFSAGNTVRRVLESALKHYCVINELDLDKLEFEQKYGHITLGDLKKALASDGKIEISQNLINTANELSHDSGKFFSKSEIELFSQEALRIIESYIEKIVS